MRNIILHHRRLAVSLAALLSVVVAGCDLETTGKPTAPNQFSPDGQPAKEKSGEKAGRKNEEKAGPVKKVELAPNIYLETRGKDNRRVIVSAEVCLQKGPLELFMTRKGYKEHEAIVTADVDARKLKAALLATGAREGSPVQFDPKYKPASGDVIKITVEYEDKGTGKIVSVPAQQWIRNIKTKKPLKHEWVFAGSRFVRNPLDPQEAIFLANEGDLVCVSNFDTALLDLPIKSSKDMAHLLYEANADKVPPVGTKVSVIFTPVPAKKK